MYQVSSIHEWNPNTSLNLKEGVIVHVERYQDEDEPSHQIDVVMVERQVAILPQAFEDCAIFLV